MACEKYSSSIIDAALGALPPVQHGEFASHARRCASCRESLDEARALLDAIDGGVKALVSTEPSPHFEAKLRARLAVEKSPRRQTQLKWIPVGALAAALIAAAGNAVFHGPKRNSVELVGGNRSSAASGAANKQGPLDSPAVKSAPTSGLLRAGENSARSLGQDFSRATVARSTAALGSEVRPGSLLAKATRQPEVLVQPGQFALVKQFADGVSAGQINGYEAVQFQQQSESGEPLESEPVDILPLQISALADPQKSDDGS
jgi:hypothetical protein